MKRRRGIRTVISMVLALFIIFGGVVVHNNEIAASSPVQEKIYTSITIHSGDSLWSIASRYCEDTADIPSYVEELKQMNSLTNERSLQTGCHLTVYYYAD